jgi:hypothetical protein
MGTSDATIRGDLPNNTLGLDATVSVDQEIGLGAAARPSQGLLRFDNLFGSDPDQVPLGSTIFSAFVTLEVQSASNGDASIRFFRMLQDWNEATATWTDPQGLAGGNILNGVTPDGVEAAPVVDAVVPLPAGVGQVVIPLNRDTVQAWANGSLDNFGWSIVTDSGNDWAFTSTDDFLSINPFRPELTILYAAPAAPGSGSDDEGGSGSGAGPAQGTFGFTTSDYTVNENGTATVRVNRVGGSTGIVNVNYEITAGTGSLADISGPASGVLNFANGELFETITIPINNDLSAERNETLNLTLSGFDLLGRSTAVLTIRDNDFNLASPSVLLSEVYINSPGNDGGSELIELTGSAAATMGSVYALILEGDVGPDEGSTDTVADLGAFVNGTNGQTLIGAQNGFDFFVPTGTTFVGRPDFDVEIVSNDSATYALLYLPDRQFYVGVFDYDWDNDGLLELPGFDAGGEGSGELTNFIDSIGITDNGVSDNVYGPEDNEIDSDAHGAAKNFYVPDAVSRKRGDTTRNSADAWFEGDLIANGDDPLVYDGPNPAPDRSTGLPSPGTAMSPGELNTGTPVQSPLVSLPTGNITTSASGVTLTFTGGPVSQFLKVAGTPGVAITNVGGAVNPLINTLPAVSGLGTGTLTLSFSGPGVIAGVLPNGNYQLNFSGNSLIGNGRAVDTNNAGTDIGSNRTFTFSVTNVPNLLGDYNANNVVDAADYTVWRNMLGDAVTAFSGADGNGNGTVDETDYAVWKAQFGKTFPGAAAGGGSIAALAADQPAAEPQALLATPEAMDLALIDLGTNSLFGAKAAGADAASSLRIAAGGSALFNRSLLVVARRHHDAWGPEQLEGDHDAVANHDDEEAKDVDDFFAVLGEMQAAL